MYGRLMYKIEHNRWSALLKAGPRVFGNLLTDALVSKQLILSR